MQRHKLWFKSVVTDAYLKAIGQVSVQWAYFETEFDSLIYLLRMDPKAAALAPKVPTSFKKRAALLRDSASICFPDSASVAKRFVHLAVEAQKLKLKRNHIAHCRWLGDGKDGTLGTINLVTREQSEITLDVLRKDASEISALIVEAMTLHKGTLPFSPFGRLTRDEQSALLNFRRRNLPPLPKPRLPARRG